MYVRRYDILEGIYGSLKYSFQGASILLEYYLFIYNCRFYDYIISLIQIIIFYFLNLYIMM